MKRILLALLLGTFCGEMLGATCTPVTVSTNYLQYGSEQGGTGPVENLFFGNWTWSFTPSFSSTSVTVQHGTWHFHSSINGYVNVRGGFGGCTLSSWTDDASHSYSLHDETTGTVTNFVPVNVEHTCTNTASCAYVLTDGTYGATLVAGHKYQLVCVNIGAVFGVGRSPNYTYVLNLTVE